MHNNLLDDNSLEIETKNVKYPSKGARFGAAFIDGTIINFASKALSSVIIAGDLTGGIWSVAFMTLIWPIYKISLEGTQGATLGKKAMNIQVVKEDGYFSPLTLADANRRFLLWWPMYILSFFSALLAAQPGPSDWLIALIGILTVGAFILYMGCVLSIFSNERGKTWHDKVGGTICVQADSL